MTELILDDVHLITDGKTLTIARSDHPNIAISLDTESCKELIDFIASLNGTEKNRRAFRVPLPNPSDLSVEICAGKLKTVVKPCNISLNGLYVELYPGNTLALALDQEVNVTLEFQGTTQVHAGVVRRREADGYGIFFSQFEQAGNCEPPDEYRNVVFELQRRWMVKRANNVRLGNQT